MRPNVDALQELVEWAEAEEARGGDKQWDQRTWVRFHHSPERSLVTDEELCNSSYCIAGKVVIDAGYRTFIDMGPTGGEASAVETEDGGRDIESLALELLGIDSWGSYTHPITKDVFWGDALFAPSLRAQRVRTIAEAIAGKEL